MRVLVVEDHKELAATIAVGLRREGMAVDIAFDGEDALRHAAGDSYEVILLDRDLPKIRGDDVCRALVARGSRSRVLMLTPAAGSSSAAKSSRCSSSCSPRAAGPSPPASCWPAAGTNTSTPTAASSRS